VAEKFYFQSLDEQRNNNINASYQDLGTVIKLVPYEETYMRYFSRMNLAVAIAMSRENLSDEGKNTYLSHIQMAIQGARIAAGLNPEKVENIENLADTYQSLQNNLAGADKWALTYYESAIKLFPTSPELHVKRGGIFFNQKDYDSAIKEFQTAAMLKQNHANSYYNLAYTYRKKGDYQKAEEAIRTVLKLVVKDSDNYKTAMNEYDLITKEEKDTESSSSSSLEAPIRAPFAPPSF